MEQQQQFTINNGSNGDNINNSPGKKRKVSEMLYGTSTTTTNNDGHHHQQQQHQQYQQHENYRVQFTTHHNTLYNNHQQEYGQGREYASEQQQQQQQQELYHNNNNYHHYQQQQKQQQQPLLSSRDFPTPTTEQPQEQGEYGAFVSQYQHEEQYPHHPMLHTNGEYADNQQQQHHPYFVEQQYQQQQQQHYEHETHIHQEVDEEEEEEEEEELPHEPFINIKNFLNSYFDQFELDAPTEDVLINKQYRRGSCSSDHNARNASNNGSGSTTKTTTHPRRNFHLISTSRLKRLLRSLQNITQQVALHVLASLEDDEAFELFKDEFKEWKVLCHAEQLRALFKDDLYQDVQYQQQAGTNDNTTSSQPVLKRRKLQHVDEEMHAEIEEERELLRNVIADYYVHLSTVETTSYDDVVTAIVESFQYHPTNSLQYFHRALAKNRYHYCVYLHCMEPYRQSGQKLDCVKSLLYGQYMCQTEILEIQQEIDVEIAYIRDTLGYNVDDTDPEVEHNYPLVQIMKREMNDLKGLDKCFEGLIHFFLDGSAEDMFEVFSDALKYDPNSIYAYCNLGVLKGFNVNGSRKTCEEGIQLLQKAIDCCTIKEEPIIVSFLHHTIAQTYMRMNNIEEALEHITLSLKFNPTMILAFFDRSSIFRNTNSTKEALIDNDTLLNMQPETPFELSNIYCNRAVLHYKLNQEREMFDALYKSTSIDPTNSFSYIMLSKQAIIKNDLEQFEALRKKLKLREHIHITHYLQHLTEAYNHFGMPQEAVKYQAQLNNYTGSWFRID